jgi:hypothetical protein
LISPYYLLVQITLGSEQIFCESLPGQQNAVTKVFVVPEDFFLFRSRQSCSDYFDYDVGASALFGFRAASALVQPVMVMRVREVMQCPCILNTFSDVAEYKLNYQSQILLQITYKKQ